MNTIETNGLTIIVAIIDAILFRAGDQSYHVIPQLCLVKLYCETFIFPGMWSIGLFHSPDNSFPVSLNSRTQNAKRLFNSTDSTGNNVFRTSNTRFQSKGSQVVPIHVSISETTHIDEKSSGTESSHPFSESLELGNLSRGNESARGNV